MKKILPALIILLLIASGNPAKAQFFIVGQDPASVKWKQITTTDFKIIFPQGYQKNALLYANTLEFTHSTTLLPYFTKPQKPFTIVLHTKSTWSNAMVFPAPLHGDFFETPGQTTYPQIWQYQLSLHEYRHYAQMRKMYQGVGKGLSYVFGQAGPMTLFGAFIPMWFVEGDAVYNETIHSKSGRGRVPLFTMDLKAQVLEKKIYPYDKAVLGSYRNYVPDYYTLGYQLVLYGAENYGYDMWNLAMERVARRPYLLKPFVNGLKTYTGLRKVKYYHKVLDTLQTQWKSELSAKQLTHPKYIVPTKPLHGFTSYRFPVSLSDGSIVAEKTGIDDINRFVKLLPDGNEEVLFTPGFDYTESLSANDSLLCWNEKQYDLRWSNRDYSIIKLYNFKTKRLKTLTLKTRLFAPSLSPDATKIAASEVTVTGENRLQIINASTGKIVQTFSTPDNLFFMTPRWSADGRSIVVTVLGKSGKSIILYEPADGSYRFLLPFGFAEINRPCKAGSHVYYMGTYRGINNLYSIELTTGQVHRLTSVKYGADSPSLTQSGALLFSDYTANGYRIALLDSGSIRPEKITRLKPFRYPVDKAVADTTFVLENTTIPDSNYKISDYSRLKHLFNIHSWGPMVVDVNTYKPVPNLFLSSQNMLGTSVSTLGYYYNVNDETGKTKFTFDYYGWYPVIGFSADYGRRRFAYTDSTGNPQLVRWHETNLKLNISVPLRFIKSKWISGITPKISVGQRFMILDKGQSITFKEPRMTFLSYSLYGYHNLKRSRRDIYSKWSQFIYATYSHTPFSSDPSGIGYVSGALTFPGILRHHGLRVFLSQQWKKTGFYPFGDYSSVPRGYSGLQFQNMMLLKVDYAFPIAYPDWDLQSAAYLTRLYAHLFFDYSDYTQPGYSGFDHIGSGGIELYTNWHFLSLPVEVTLGFRGSITFGGTFVPEFLFSFSL